MREGERSDGRSTAAGSGKQESTGKGKEGRGVLRTSGVGKHRQMEGCGQLTGLVEVDNEVGSEHNVHEDVCTREKGFYKGEMLIGENASAIHRRGRVETDEIWDGYGYIYAAEEGKNVPDLEEQRAPHALLVPLRRGSPWQLWVPAAKGTPRDGSWNQRRPGRSASFWTNSRWVDRIRAVYDELESAALNLQPSALEIFVSAHIVSLIL